MAARSASDLITLKYQTGLEHVTIDYGTLAPEGLLPHGLKYGLWALRPGGRLTVCNTGGEYAGLRLFKGSLNHALHVAQRLIGREAVVDGMDRETGSVTYRRVAAAFDNVWSAGILFSGSDAETAAVIQLIGNLRAQPELASATILVCGPAAGEAKMKGQACQYLVWDDVGGERFSISRKKNALLRALPGEKLLVMHSRIRLDPECLAGMPHAFDLTTPKVGLLWKDSYVPYFDLNFLGSSDLFSPIRHAGVSRQYRRANYLTHFRSAFPYIDGGLFAVSRRAFEQCPLNDDLAWGEMEDVEWCQRARQAGLLIDLAERSQARSTTSKLRRAPLAVSWLDRAGRIVAHWTIFGVAWLTNASGRLLKKPHAG
jgi:hypothetical protein